MRFVAIAFLLLSYPLFIVWLRAYPQQRHWAYFGMGLLPFTIDAWNLDVAIVNWGMWSGYAKGILVTLLDSLALAVIATHRNPRGVPPLIGYFIAYLLAALLSVAASEVPMASTFYPFQLLRMLVLIIAVAKIAHQPRALTWLAMGLAAGISYQAYTTIEQKLQGVFQATGTMGHQNLLGLMDHFVTFPLLGVLLAGMRSNVVKIGLVSSIIVIALGASRGAIGFTLAGVALLLILSLIRQSTARKWQMIGFSALTLVLISPLMLQGMEKRFTLLAKEGSYDERAAFERAAKAMLADHPMGVGANQYVVISNTKGYAQRAGVIWTTGSRGAHVHNVYLLVAAETGWVGLLSFLTLFAAIIVTGLRFVFQDRRDPRGEIVLGCTVAVIITAAHNLYEWIFVTYQAQYVFAISLGIIGALVRARATERQQQRRNRREAGSQVRLESPGAVALGRLR